ncbi:TetR family transcriptional regulator [Nonomuraea phyllanthi]|uniref:TetR/AcrR family transcriptional regulator n=1 Tax=Nonomuraea phyllanthi TaxID=2219224 RepID=UPI001292ED80|nr:TetR/AcrR family transcriptional regulator [Nonomuraea phyllanthi]QFY06524.1 TetR family transcriptional regulator [Nonomuraea phyllanthi]
MSIAARRARERAQRHQLIISAARELAESEGWEAVTTRRLSERVEYSQPVLYSHFKGKDAIVRAVAIEGFAELAGELRAARTTPEPGDTAMEVLRRVAMAYLGFARTRGALYEAMFVMPTAIPFASEETPEELRAAFGEFVLALEPVAGEHGSDTFAEVVWAALHGLATLAHDGRIPPERQQARVDLLVDHLARPTTPSTP